MKFLRQDYHRFSRLGKGRKKLQKWRRSKGGHSKMRMKRRSYPAGQSPGYKTHRSEFSRIKGLLPVLVHNVHELSRVTKDRIAVIAKVGAKKKLEIIKKAEESKIPVFNIRRKSE